MPSSLRELREQGIIVLLTSQDDARSAGFVPWRLALYVSGGVPELQNALRLLNDFFQHRSKATQPGDVPFPDNPRLALSVEAGLQERLNLAQDFDMPTEVLQPSADVQAVQFLSSASWKPCRPGARRS